MKKYLIFFGMMMKLFPLLHAETEIEQLKKQICNVHPSFEGWCSREKALTLIDLVLEIHPKVCVDIGVFGGSSLFPIASTLKFLGSGIVIGIDPWDKLESIKDFDPVQDEAHLKWWSQLDFNYIYDTYLKALKRFGVEKYCITIKATSVRAAAAIDHIDLLHIDGNHSEEGFRSDVELYLPKVRSGGYILLNDSLWGNAQDAVDLLLTSCDVVRLIDFGNCIVFKKR